MNVPTVTVPPELAKEKLAEYRKITVTQRRAEDAAFRKMWRAAASGKPILDLLAAFQFAGLNKQGLPKLGFARADWKYCHFDGPWKEFRACPRWESRLQANRFNIPRDALDWNRIGDKRAFSKVPFIPPEVRKNIRLKLENYFILFEVDDWKMYPSDPFLLRHVTDNLYVVVGEWDLTPLEVSLLRGLR